MLFTLTGITWLVQMEYSRYLNVSGKSEQFLYTGSNLRQIIGTLSATVSDPESDKYKLVLICSVPIFMR